MNKSTLGIVGALVLIVAGGIYFSSKNTATQTGTTQAELSGTVTYRERVALLPGSIVEVTLQDVSRADAPAVVIAESTIITEGENVPIPFTLTYDPAQIDPRYSYSVRATITTNGELAWTTDTHNAVLTNGNPLTDIALVLKQVASNTRSNGASGTAAAVDDEIVACLTDVQECSDGTYVSRIAPSCNFAACPMPNPILGTEWTWQHTVFLNGTKTMPQDSGKFVIQFGEDKRVTSTTDCNNVFGGFIVDGEILSIGPLASTRMACASGSLESEYSQELSRTTSYVITGNELRLNLLKDSGTMVFAKRAAAVNLNGSTFRLASFNENAIANDAKYTLTFTDDSISAKFCNGMGGEYTLENGVITAANLIGTLMYCAQPADLMTIENTFGSILRTGAGFSLEGSTLTLTGDSGEKMVFTIFMD